MYTPDQPHEEKSNENSKLDNESLQNSTQNPSPLASQIKETNEEGLKAVSTSTGTDPLPEMAQQHALDENAILQGRIYPPPPAFYQTTKNPTAQPAQPPVAPSQTVQPLPILPPLTEPGQAPSPGYKPVLQPHPQQFRQAPPHRRSRSWIWITITVLALALIGSCGICAWAVNFAFGDTLGQSVSIVTDGIPMLNNYYDAIQNKNYRQAYSFLSSPTITQQQFIQQAEDHDSSYGPVYRYTVGQPSVEYVSASDPKIKGFKFTVDVARAKKTYTVILTVRKIDKQWKITAFDNI